MARWEVGLSTGCFYRRPILEVLEPIRNTGFEWLEISSHPEHCDYRDPAQAAARLRAHHLVLHPGPEIEFAQATDNRVPRMNCVIDSLEQVTARWRSTWPTW